MSTPERASVQASYDRVAEEYTRRIYDELRHKPLDRELLDRFAAEVGEAGPVCDVGCGPGQVARYLHDRGVRVAGIDLSPAMIERARRFNPGIDFSQADLCHLPAADGAYAGLTAFYSIIHIPRGEVSGALRELRRVLRPGGLLLASFHIGGQVLHLDELWGTPVSLDFVFFEPDEMTGLLRGGGFEVTELVERDPYPEVEVQTRRAYVFARAE